MAKAPTKPKVPDSADDKEQSERFIDAAREHETDETGRSLEDAFKTVARPVSGAKQELPVRGKPRA